MAAASFFFQALSGMHKKQFEKKMKVIGTPQDELLSYWLSFDKNHPQRCVIRKKMCLFKKCAFKMFLHHIFKN